MKTKGLILLFILFSNVVYSQQEDKKDDFSSRLRESNFSLGVQLQTKYVWRGMEMQTEDAAPVLFPSINYGHNGFSAYVMGGYATNGKYAEVDLGASYTYKWVTVGVADYYYPSTNSAEDKYFNFRNHNTGHWFEGYVTITPDKIPLSLTISNFFAGADKNADGKQAYSTYAEIGTWYDFLNNNQIALNLGAAFNKSCYNGYAHNFGVCNVEAKYTHTLQFKNDWTLPLSVSYIINPVYEKSFVNFTAYFGF